MEESKKYILGLHGFSASSGMELHNTGAALVRDGKIVAAMDEERFSRIKNDGRFPFSSLEAVMDDARIDADTIRMIALPDKRPLWELAMTVKYIVKTFVESGVFMPRYLLSSLRRTLHLRRTVPRCLSSVPKVFIEHHLCHAASAYYTCPWDKATILTLDGMGDYCMAGIAAAGIKGKINIIKRLNGFYSPGIYYAMITDLLGFTAGRHEGKVTGLAAFGNARPLMPVFEDILAYKSGKLDFFSKIIPYEIDRYSFKKGQKDPIRKMKARLQGFGREDIAAAAQKRLEDVVTDLVADIVKVTGIGNIVLAGGIFANVKLNQKIQEMDCVDHVYIFPAMNDGGLSTGAALYAEYNCCGKKFIPKELHDVYAGSEFSDAEIEQVLVSDNIRYERPECIEKEIARLLADGQVVAHFNGRMEYGPRALGNRSVLAAATDPAMNRLLNHRLKRTEFMPFAPAVLCEHAKNLYENWTNDNIPGRFMTMTFHVTEEHKRLAPAAVHADGTARPQTVDRLVNPRFYNIINEYYKLTGVPLVLNTSFNIHEEPIVRTPQEALKILRLNAVDALVLNKFLIRIKP